MGHPRDAFRHPRRNELSTLASPPSGIYPTALKLAAWATLPSAGGCDRNSAQIAHCSVGATAQNSITDSGLSRMSIGDHSKPEVASGKLSTDKLLEAGLLKS